MPRTKTLATTLLVGTALYLGCEAPPAEGPGTSLAFAEVAVVDVEAGTVQPGLTVLVVEDEITAVGPAESVEIPDGARIVDGTDRYLIPGLWDMHVHLAHDPATHDLYLANGVTGVREMGGNADSTLATRARLRSGELLGPRVVTAGPLVDGPKEGIPWRLTVRDSAEAVAAVDSLARLGVDFVKVHNGIAPEPFFAAAERARELGLDLVGHPPPSVGLHAAVEAGMASLEHTTAFLEAGLPPSAAGSIEELESATDSLLEAASDGLFPTMRRQGTWFDPTLVAGVAAAERLDPSREPWPEEVYMPRSLQRMEEMWGGDVPEGGVPPAVIDARRRVARLGLTIAGAAHRASVPLLAGTDVGLPGLVPGFALHRELELLVEAGLSPADALRAATIGPARLLGATDSLGTVAPGRKADLVLLTGNPLDSIAHTRRIEAVVRGGKLLDRRELDTRLEGARRNAAPEVDSSGTPSDGGPA